ncbi:MAG: hypothetical protein IPJ00_14045 [Saprospirales bacterium]|nr:hypothetical protein [Saprospirales bacterium]
MKLCSLASWKCTFLITRHFNIYGGAGIHKGWSTSNRDFVDDPYGLTFIGGAELTLGRINISYDFKPSLNIDGGERRFYTTQALSLRFVLIKDSIFYKGGKKRRIGVETAIGGSS